MSLATDVRALVEACNDVDRLHLEPDLDRNLICLAMIRDARQTLMYAERELENKLASQMDEKRVVVDGVATFERRKKKTRTAWDTDDLLRAVLDTRVVNEETGEIADETPLDKVLATWNLGAPRVTVLKARGLDADQFCHAEPAGYSIQILN